MNQTAPKKAKLIWISVAAIAAVIAIVALVIWRTDISSMALASGDGDKASRKERERTTIRTAVEQGQLVPLPRILELAQNAVTGDVVKTELEMEDEKLVYEIKILTPNGRIREVEFDAGTGAVLSIEDD